MKLNRLKIVALCLGVALLVMTGSAMAGTTTFTAIKFAREVGVANATYTLPAATINHAMNVVRTAGGGQDFFLDFTIDSGKIIATPFTPGVSVASGTGLWTLSIASAGAGAATLTQLTTVGSGVASLRFLVHVTTDFANLPTISWL